ncbi:MAG TPA: dihydrofolate reductase [Candidatus Paceibacterota bacterium]|nr:dihydrofolate reductase [Candidatus Paceibacterota bacterium]HPT18310.1 dihydrofolate reductase [Candidatus Paceibacterota bacterium]
MISIISAIGKNNEIGKKNDLLWNLPADMKHFKETTSGHTVIMGQKTFESLGKDTSGKQIGRLLPNRRNIIISQDSNLKIEGAEIVHSIDELLDLLKNTTQENEEVFVIGGGSIYRIMIEKADKLYITHVDAEFPDAEIFFPEIDENIWQKTTSQKYSKDDLNKYDLEFVEYTKKA